VKQKPRKETKLKTDISAGFTKNERGFFKDKKYFRLSIYISNVKKLFSINELLGKTIENIFHQ
jgi:hypothetical protein